MGKSTCNHGAEILFSSISPTELWDRLGLAQPSDKKELKEDMPHFSSEESRLAYEAFREECPQETEISEEMSIPSDKGSLFIWALLKQCSKRSKTDKKLSSVNHLFKDDVARTARYTGKRLGIQIDEEDFDNICSYLQQKRLVATSRDSIRITKHFTELFHERYNAWLVF